MKPNQLIRYILKDIKVQLTADFDENFERKAFFDERWPETKHGNHRGSLMMRGGNLRRSIQSHIRGNTLSFTSSKAYAAIHNEGGEITVTRQMQKFFWAMHIKARNATQVYSIKTRKRLNNKTTRARAEEAIKWRAMALKKVGSKIQIPQRQFVGHHRETDRAVRRVVHHNMQELNKTISQNHGTR